ncbi:ABC transporter substrate-binding protein [Clostridium lundense]|uniref:ABC transporter substrate-binding protein n=1 Tax=Clostridium lundense TaxID=319475 RepID=UPI0005567E9B|nr:extracellular solute-binding protein [Clostridium lundense]
MFNIKKTKLKKYISCIIILCLIISLVGCKGKEASTKEKKLSIYVDIKDKHSLNIIKFLIDEYKKEQPKTNITVNNSMGTDTLKDISKGNAGDIMFISRNKMIELQGKGLLSDLSSYYDKNKINESYYNVINSYGRYSDKYYGLGIMPYTLEMFYNKEALKKINTKEPTNIKDGQDILGKLNKQSIKVPVILTEDIDINNAIASLMISNKKNIYNVDSIYNSSKEAYKDKKEFQSIFDNIQTLYKSGIVNKNTFEIGNENTIKRFVNGDIPMIVSISYYYKELNNKDIGLIEDYSSIASFKGNVPIIVNALLSVPINGENAEEVNEFIKFVFNEKTQKKLFQKGFITGNMKINEEAKDLGKSIAKHLKEGNENSIIFLYNIPEKFYVAISSKIEKILSGQYTGKEWTSIVDEVFKYK